MKTVKLFLFEATMILYVGNTYDYCNWKLVNLPARPYKVYNIPIRYISEHYQLSEIEIRKIIVYNSTKKNT